MRFLRSLVARLRAWRKKPERDVEVQASWLLSFNPSIYREVTPNGVRVYSLCGGCGARLACSATLCEECARGPHTSTF
jgi:hypothetical protein